MKTIVQIAIEIACKAHDKQYRRDGVTPYITHPASVAARLAWGTEELVAAAWLHDVLEDTPVTDHDLFVAGITRSAIDAICLLTREKGEDYFEYLGRIKNNELALLVKRADILHNLSDSPTDKQRAKYEKALQFLSE